LKNTKIKIKKFITVLELDVVPGELEAFLRCGNASYRRNISQFLSKMLGKFAS
jgi:hypothetical protein